MPPRTDLRWFDDTAALVPLIRNLLFGIEGAGLTVYAAPAVVLLLVSLAACVQPAIRAARIDAIRVLRQD